MSKTDDKAPEGATEAPAEQNQEAVLQAAQELAEREAREKAEAALKAEKEAAEKAEADRVAALQAAKTEVAEAANDLLADIEAVKGKTVFLTAKVSRIIHPYTLVEWNGEAPVKHVVDEWVVQQLLYGKMAVFKPE